MNRQVRWSSRKKWGNREGDKKKERKEIKNKRKCSIGGGVSERNSRDTNEK